MDKGYKENKKVDDFLYDVIEISKKHGLSISHEDSQGAFIIEKYSDENIEWIQNSFDGILKKQDKD